MYNLVFSVQKKLAISFFMLLVVVVAITIFLFFSLIGIDVKVHLISGIFFLIVSAVFGSYLSVLFELPEIFNKFDIIKNDIANKRIKTCKEFCRRLLSFLEDEVNYSFFSIKAGFIKIIGEDYVFSDNEIMALISEDEYKKYEKYSQKSEQIEYFGQYNINQKSYHSYILPFWLKSKYLGYMIIFTERRLRGIFLSFLKNFEDICIDDQLVNVINYKKEQETKTFYREIDKISNKITKQQYSSIIDYQKDLIKLLKNKTGCLGAICSSVYSLEDAILFDSGISKYKDTIDYIKNFDFDLDPKILQDPNIQFKYIFSLPIFIDKLRGVVYLFDNNRESFDYFKNMLIEINKIKIDNDLENLAILLNLKIIKNKFPTYRL